MFDRSHSAETPHHSAVTKDQLAERVAELEAEVKQLRIALGSARVIGAAVGIVMATRRLAHDDAFAVLSEASQLSNVKLRTVAGQVVATGVVP